MPLAVDPTPPSLLDRLRRPDPAAWERFVDLYAPLLRAWARRLGADGPDADDLVQDVLALLVRALEAEARRLAAEAAFGFRQALRQWPENHSAATGLKTCLLRTAEFELDERNATDELVGSGYGGRVFVLAREPGYGLESSAAQR